MTSLRTTAAVLSVAFLAACGGVVASAGPPVAVAQATAESGACRDYTEQAYALVFSDLHEAWAHRPTDEGFAAYFGAWMEQHRADLTALYLACVEPEGAPVP